MSLRRCLRQLVRPTGRRRAPHPVEETVPIDDLLRPTEALVTDWAYCPAEDEDTLHVILTTGGRICWTCRAYTDSRPLTSAPRPDGAE
ncbi:hypothetical protein [Streptomyces sp. NPDC004135]